MLGKESCKCWMRRSEAHSLEAQEGTASPLVHCKAPCGGEAQLPGADLSFILTACLTPFRFMPLFLCSFGLVYSLSFIPSGRRSLKVLHTHVGMANLLFSIQSFANKECQTAKQIGGYLWSVILQLEHQGNTGCHHNRRFAAKGACRGQALYFSKGIK